MSKKLKKTDGRPACEVLYQNDRIRVVCVNVQGEGRLVSEKANGFDATGAPIWRNTVNEVSADFIWAIAELKGMKCMPGRGWVRDG